MNTTRPLRVGLFGIGLEAYWSQFEGLKERLEGYVAQVADKLARPGVEICNAGLVEFVKQIPRGQLERKFLLRKMQDQQQKEGYTAKVKAWLEKPEQAEVLKAIRSMISRVMKPERQVQVIVNQAKNFIKNSGVKLS